MADLIDRQAAIREGMKLVGARRRWVSDAGRMEISGIDAYMYAIHNLPSTDAVEVVRCKDCKHYQFADNRAFGFPVKRCEWTGFEDVDDDDFCSRGEQRDG